VFILKSAHSTATFVKRNLKRQPSYGITPPPILIYVLLNVRSVRRSSGPGISSKHTQLYILIPAVSNATCAKKCWKPVRLWGVTPSHTQTIVSLNVTFAWKNLNWNRHWKDIIRPTPTHIRVIIPSVKKYLRRERILWIIIARVTVRRSRSNVQTVTRRMHSRISSKHTYAPTRREVVSTNAQNVLESSLKSIKMHLITHTKTSEFMCGFCIHAAQSQPDLENHIRTHTKEAPFSCIECGQTFQHKSSLNSHMRRHGGDKTHKCRLCDYASFEEEKLWQTMCWQSTRRSALSLVDSVQRLSPSTDTWKHIFDRIRKKPLIRVMLVQKHLNYPKRSKIIKEFTSQEETSLRLVKVTFLMKRPLKGHTQSTELTTHYICYSLLLFVQFDIDSVFDEPPFQVVWTHFQP